MKDNIVLKPNRSPLALWSSAMHRSVPSGWFGMALAVPLLVAIVVTGYLTYVAVTASPIYGCGGGELWDCGHVTNSRWSKWLGVPVSVLALGMYLSGGVCLLVANTGSETAVRRKVAWMLLTLLGFSAGLAAVWFVALQLFAVEHLCSYCLTAHACALALAGLLIWRHPAGWPTTGLVAVGSAMGLSVLVGGQLLTKPPVTYEIEHHTVDVPGPGESEPSPSDRAPTFNPPGEIDDTDETLFTAPPEEPFDETSEGLHSDGDNYSRCI